MAATAQSAANETAPKHLSEAVKRFCRSIELCDDYLRGYYGLKLVSRGSRLKHTYLLTSDKEKRV